MSETELTNPESKSKKTMLKQLATICKWLGWIATIFGIMAIIGSITHRGEDIGITIGVFFGGFFTLLYGYMAEAIDEIRDSLKKE